MALTDMRLRVFSGLLVASLLGGCASTKGTVDDPSGVVETPKSVAAWRWIEVAEVLRRHVPMPDGARGIYLLTTREQPLVTVHGEPIDKACTDDSCKASLVRARAGDDRVFRLDPSLGLIPIPKADLAALREKLGAKRIDEDPDAFAFYLLDQQVGVGGFWRGSPEGGTVLNTDSAPYELSTYFDGMVIDGSIDNGSVLPEMRPFYGSALMFAIEHGNLYDELPGLVGGSPERALIRPLADGAKLITVGTSKDCATSRGTIHYVVPKGSRTPIKVAQSLPDAHPIPCQTSRGRPPAGLVSRPTPLADPVADFYASAAHLEAASVVAFERLAAELAAHGAPQALVDNAISAAADERRHAEAMLVLGARHGVTATPVEVSALVLRSTMAIAIENAVEGCVNEAFAAVLCDYQAAAAEDPALARAMRVIAEEEHGHAELAARTAAWLDTQLTIEERAGVRAAVDAALESLPDRAMMAAASDSASAAQLGMPCPARAETLARRFVAFMTEIPGDSIAPCC